MIEDTKEYNILQGDTISLVCKACAISDYVLEHSQEAYIGNDDAESVTAAYVRKLLDMFLYHPYKNGVSKTAEESLEILKSILSIATERFAMDDTFGLFDNPIEYIICFNTFCVDIAREEHGLNEADYHFMVDEHNLSSNKAVHPFYQSLANALKL